MLVSRMTARAWYCISVSLSNLFHCSIRSQRSSVDQTNHLLSDPCAAVLGMLPGACALSHLTKSIAQRLYRRETCQMASHRSCTSSHDVTHSSQRMLTCSWVACDLAYLNGRSNAWPNSPLWGLLMELSPVYMDTSQINIISPTVHGHWFGNPCPRATKPCDKGCIHVSRCRSQEGWRCSIMSGMIW
jgi:hypothetical protein